MLRDELKTIPLGDAVTQMKTGSTPSTTHAEFFGSDIPWFTPGDIGSSKYLTISERTITQDAVSFGKAKIFKEGMLLVTCIGDIGRVGVLQQTSSSNQQITALKFKDEIDVDYAYYWFISNKQKLVGLANQAVVPILNNERLSEINFTYPPLTEQKRIVSLLARADRLRQLRRTAHDLGESLLQSVFLEMFGDVAQSKWEKYELGELIEGFEAGVNYLPGRDGEPTSDWRVLKISAVTWGDFDPTESKAMREYENIDETHIVRQGDLLISRANTTELVGAVSLVKINPPKVLLPDKLWRVKFREDSPILPEYTLHVLRQPALRKIIGDLATGSSGSMKNISMEKAATLPIPVPPLNLQEEFASLVARVESMRSRQAEGERQVDGLFESMLTESFGGSH